MTTVETVRCDLCAYQLADVTATTASNVFRGRCLTHGRRTILLRSTGLARATDPQTSQDAAESINPRGQQEKLLRTLAHMTDANRYELAQAAGLTEYQAGRRLSELNDSGLIAWTGEVRPGATGRSQSVWKVTQAGYRWLQGPEGLL